MDAVAEAWEQGRPVGSVPGLVVCGTGSGVGKSLIVTGLCRALAQRGQDVAPFKAQNMSNNAGVAVDGGEIGRAQLAQADAAGVAPTTAMNPILLKPTADGRCDVVVRGRVVGTSTAAEHAAGTWTARMQAEVLAAFDEVAATHDVVVCEGAGGAAEINLLDRDVVNLPFARAAGLPAVVVVDIERGGAFSALFGVWAILPPALQATIRGFVINRFRGDPTVLASGIAELESRTGVPVLGVIPWLAVPGAAAEDAEFLPTSRPTRTVVDVAVIRLPRVANTTDLEPLAAEPRVRVRWVECVDELGRPDLIVVPGSKCTVDDLAWLRDRGLADALRDNDATVIGICAGYQMLGERIVDPIESRQGTVDGLGLLPITTTFLADKVVARRAGVGAGDSVVGGGAAVDGYEIRNGRPEVTGSARPWFRLQRDDGADAPEGAVDAGGRVHGTSLHGLFAGDGFRRAVLDALVARRGGGGDLGPPLRWAELIEHRTDAVADHLEAHLDIDRLLALANVPAPVARRGRN